MEPYANDLVNYPYTIRTQRIQRKGQPDQKRILCEDICCFDIETTSFFFDYDKKPFLYHPGEDPEYWTGIYAGSLPYIWQFGINGNTYYGRDIESFYKLLDDIPENMHIRIFVHNLSFEFAHIIDGLTWNKIFAKSVRKPIRASCAEHPNIEFCDTLSLENRSLESWGNALGFPKLVGFLDYNQMRTPLTPLTDDEMAYAERDIQVMYKGLQEELKIYKSVWKLPMTSTGKTRKVVKERLFAVPGYEKDIKRLVPENAYQYKTSMYCLQGGYTHANRTFVNMTVYNEDGKHGGHYDFTSSYPYELVASKFPMGLWAYMPKVLPDPSTFDDYAYKMHVVFTGIESQLQNNYIASNHCTCINATVDNGRISAADELDMWMTENDLAIILQAYRWKRVDVLEVWRTRKEYLPKEFVEYVLELFNNKTALKKIAPEEYALSKMHLNALFGMCITALIMGDVVFDPDTFEWSQKRVTTEMVTEHLKKLRGFKNKQYFLNYDWGCHCANASRKRLWDLIIKYDRHVMYADTDSIFTNIAIDFTEYNNEVNKHLEKVCKERGLDVCKTRPINPVTKEQSFLGNLTTEEEWTEFRTLGAKRYVERWKSDGKLHLTVAGINKEAVSCLHDDIDNFRNGLLFDKDEKDVSKLMHTYVDNMPDITFPDGYVSHRRHGVNLRPNGYRLNMDPSFDDIIAQIGSSIHNESYDRHLRSIWYDDLPFAEDVHYVQLNIGKE